MKILLLNFLSFIIMNSSCLLADDAHKSSVLLTNGAGSLEFEDISSKDGLSRLKLTRPGENEVVVWERQHDPNSMVYNPSQREQDPYVGAKLVGADLRDGVILVLLRLDSKNHGLFGVHPKLRDKEMEYRKEWNGFDYFLRSFTLQNDGSWGIYISAYPGTFWPDVLNEEVIKISIKDKNAYNITYKGALQMFGNLTNRFANKFKVVQQEGLTEKHLVYDNNDQLLYSLAANMKERNYIDGSIWWNSFDEFSRSNSVPTNFHVVMNTHEARCKELKIEPKEFMYLRKGTKEESEKRRDSLNERVR